jgi:hypothetical protein
LTHNNKKKREFKMMEDYGMDESESESEEIIEEEDSD